MHDEEKSCCRINLNRGPVRPGYIFCRSVPHDIDTDHAEFTAGRIIVITADAITVLFDHGMAPFDPLLIAFDEFGLLLSVTGTRRSPGMYGFYLSRPHTMLQEKASNRPKQLGISIASAWAAPNVHGVTSSASVAKDVLVNIGLSIR